MANIAILSRYTQDIGLDTRLQARYIGNLEDGRSKISVNSALSVKDKADNFRFRVTQDGFVRIRTGELVGKDGTANTVAPDGTVQYKLLSASGAVIADSNPNAGGAYQAYQKLTGNENLKLGKGSYVIQVLRDRGALDSKDYIYALTLRNDSTQILDKSVDRASREFLTTERPGNGVDVTGTAAVLGLFSAVNMIA